MDRDDRTALGCFGGMFGLVLLINLAVLGFLGWAIYRLVVHFT